MNDPEMDMSLDCTGIMTSWSHLGHPGRIQGVLLRSAYSCPPRAASQVKVQGPKPLTCTINTNSGALLTHTFYPKIT